MERDIKNFAIGAFLLVFIVVSTLFTVKEGEQGIVLRLGEILQSQNGNVITYEPGIHVKLPLIEIVKKFDVRLRTFNVPSSRILTKDLLSATPNSGATLAACIPSLGCHRKASSER